jgi:hypothetical protein
MQVLYTTKGKTNVELSSIFSGTWPHYIGNPHTNERGLSASIDPLPRTYSTSLAELSLQLHTTSGVAEIYICNTQSPGRQILQHDPHDLGKDWECWAQDTNFCDIIIVHDPAYCRRLNL